MLKNIYIESCPSCGTKNNAFYTAGGENDTPYSVLYTATKGKDGTFTPDMNKGLPVLPVVCVNCDHVMLFKAD